MIHNIIETGPENLTKTNNLYQLKQVMLSTKIKTIYTVNVLMWLTSHRHNNQQLLTHHILGEFPFSKRFFILEVKISIWWISTLTITSKKSTQIKTQWDCGDSNRHVWMSLSMAALVRKVWLWCKSTKLKTNNECSRKDRFMTYMIKRKLTSFNILARMSKSLSRTRWISQISIQ